MTGFRPLAVLAILFASLASASAQLVVTLQMARNGFVGGESIPVAVNITNHSGQDLVLQGDSRTGWIDFNVTSQRAVPLSPVGRASVGGVKIPQGRSISKTVDLASLFPLSEVGNYSAYAIVRIPGRNGESFTSNRVLFNISSGAPYWSQKVGVPGRPGQSREFKVLNFNNGNKSMLYAQVNDPRTGSSLQVHSLGEVLMFRKPAVALDRSQVMHVLYLTTPSIWAHSRIGPDGAFLGLEYHKRGSADPTLMTMPNGAVEVGNSIRFDPKAEAEARAKVRKATDRPAYLYE